MMEFGTRIRMAREQAGLSQTDLAQRVGVTRGLVGQWETQRKKPGRDNLLRLAQATSVSLAFLAGESEAAVSRLNISAADEVALILLYRSLDRNARKNLAILLTRYYGIAGPRLNRNMISGRRPYSADLALWPGAKGAARRHLR